MIIIDENLTYGGNIVYRFEIEPGLALKPLELRDTEQLYQVIIDSREHLRVFLPFVDHTKTSEDTKKFVNNAVRDNAIEKSFVSVIMVDDQVAGLVGMNQINWENKNAELGYWLGSSFTRRGIMTKATRAIIDYAFNELNLNRLEIRAAFSNKASRGVAEKLNFVQEGIIRDAEWINDRFVDHVVYGLLKREWQAN